MSIKEDGIKVPSLQIIPRPRFGAHQSDRCIPPNTTDPTKSPGRRSRGEGGGEGEAELLDLGEKACLLDAAEDLALLKLLDHVHAHLLSALLEEPRPLPPILPNLVIPIHLESKMGS